MTVEEAAALLRVDADTVERLIQDGRLPAVKVGQDWRINKDNVIAFINAGGDTVDPTGGRWMTSLALVPTSLHTPCISYHVGGVRPGVKFACWDGTTWISKEVAGGHEQGRGGVSLALEPTYPYTPHISHGLPWDVHDLKHAYLSGTVWMSGTWVRETVDSDGTVGGHPSLVLEPTHPYTPHISYWGNSDLKYTWLSGTTWLSETVDSEGDVGWCTSLALDSSGNPHISYLDFTNRDLKYAWLSGTTWLSTTVDSEGDVGHYPKYVYLPPLAYYLPVIFRNY